MSEKVIDQAAAFSGPATVHGEGRAVFVLAERFAGSPAHLALARRFRVSVLEPLEADPLKAGAALAALIAGGPEGPVGLVGVGAGAGAALVAAGLAQERVNALVLVSPVGLPLLDEPETPLTPLARSTPAPKVVLLGTDDPHQPADAASRYRTSYSRCQVVLVWEAGADIAGDRPEALASAAGDFLDRQTRFGFMTDSVAVSP